MTAATLALIAALLGWAPLALVFSWSLRRLRRDLFMVMRAVEHQSRCIGQIRAELADLRANERTNALDICRIGDEHVETRGYVMGHARALDAHDERLQALEGADK